MYYEERASISSSAQFPVHLTRIFNVSLQSLISAFCRFSSQVVNFPVCISSHEAGRSYHRNALLFNVGLVRIRKSDKEIVALIKPLIMYIRFHGRLLNPGKRMCTMSSDKEIVALIKPLIMYIRFHEGVLNP